MGQHRGLGSPRGAGREEEPAGIVVLDGSVVEPGPRMRRYRFAHRLLGEGALADPPRESERGARRLDRGGMVGEIAVAQERLGAGGRREIGHLVRHQPEIGGNPDRAEPERREHRPEHLVAILGMHQDAVALDDAARGERRRQRGDAAVDLAPAPGPVAPDEARPVAVTAGILRQHMSEIHDPAGHALDAARGRGRGNGVDHLNCSCTTGSSLIRKTSHWSRRISRRCPPIRYCNNTLKRM